MSSANSGINVNGNGYGAVTKAFGASQPAGSLLVAVFRFSNLTNTVSSISHGGTAADAWAQAARRTDGVGVAVEIWYCKNSGTAAGTFTVTPTYSGTDSYKGLDIYGFSGCDTTSQPDFAGSALTSSTATPTTGSLGTSTTTDPVLICAAASNDSSAMTWAVATNYTANSGTVNLWSRDNCAYGLPGASGSYAGHFNNNTGTARVWGIAGAIFKGTAAAGGGKAPPFSGVGMPAALLAA